MKKNDSKQRYRRWPELRQMFNIMKLTTVVFFIALFQVSAKSYSQETRLNLKFENENLEKVFSEIEANSEFSIFYKNDLIRDSKEVSGEFKDAMIFNILDQILKSENLTYTIKDKLIMILPKDYVANQNSSQQQKQVAGKVTDSSGASLPGVSVVVKGTTTGVITDINGMFSIFNLPENATLQFSFVGMKTQEIQVVNQTVINVKLTEESIGIEDVVVTALGIKRSEKALGYAVQKVSGESLQKVSGVDLATSLTGKVAGLLVKNSSDFAAAPELTIRGEKPLLVIDGVAYQNKTLSDISSEDIESMSVLKGATASALYGFRGANGAIMVTTKNGSSNKAGITVDVSTNTMFTAGFLALPEKQSVYGRGGNNTYDKNSYEVWGTKMDGAIQNQWDPILMDYRDYAYLPVGKDNFKNFLEQGYVTNTNVNIGYKGDIVSLRGSVNWTENKGQYPNSKLDKYTYAFGGDINLEKFKMSSNLSYAQKSSPNMGSNGYTSYDPMYSLLIWSGADYNILDYKNNYWKVKDQEQNFTYSSETNNPYFDRYEKTNEVSRDIFNADLSLSYELTGWLKASLRSGLDFYKDRGQLRTSWGSYLMTGNTSVPGNPGTWNGYMTGGYNTGQTTGFSMNTDFLLTGDRSINKFKVEYLAGGTIYSKRDDNINANTVGGISVPAFFSLNASVNPAYVSENTYRQQVNSLYGRVAISWNKTLFAEATGRNDWSSTLPKTTRSYFYPSLSTSFVISELLPESAKNWLDLLKIRSSWTMSKRPADIYAVNSSYSITSGTWGTMNGANAPSSLYSPGVLPESATTFETGLQGMMFKNRLMVDVSYYDKKMYDLLTYAPVTAASGYSSNYVNTDEEISRRGWELTVNGSPIKNKDWQLDLGFNWSTYKQIYTQFDSTYTIPKPWKKIGGRVDALASREFLRDPAGNLIYDNGRLQYSQYDSNFGWTDPDWIWGVNSTLRYKNFSLFLSVDGVVGGLMNTRTESYMWQSGVHPGSVTAERALDVAGALTPTLTDDNNFLGAGVKIVSGTATYDAVGNITSDTRVFEPNDIKSTYKQYVIDLHNSSAWGGAGSSADTYSRSFLKLREMSLTYSVPGKYLHGWAKAASVSFIGQNVLLWAKDFKYSDPDGGIEDFSDPSVRYLGCNIKLTF